MFSNVQLWCLFGPVFLIYSLQRLRAVADYFDHPPTVPPAESIHRIVFISVSNPLSCMADTAAQVQEERTRVAGGVTGMAVAGHDRWVCILEGAFDQVEALHAGIINITRPKALHLLLADPRNKQRVFPHHQIGWRFDAALLEMAAFVSDLHRYSRRASLWKMPLAAITPLLEPQD